MRDPQKEAEVFASDSAKHRSVCLKLVFAELGPKSRTVPFSPTFYLGIAERTNTL